MSLRVRIDISDERIASIIRVERISELGATIRVTRNWSTQRKNKSPLIRATRRHISEDGILHIHRRENFKLYIISIIFRKRNSEFYTNMKRERKAENLLPNSWTNFKDNNENG
jgi:hypothetical protein